MSKTKHTFLKKDIKFDPASSLDKFGRVFWHDDKVYRSVTFEYIPLAKKIIKQSNVWANYGLIETSESDFRLEDTFMVLTHRTIKFRSYCGEWTPEMLKDAALCYLRLQLQLIKDGYILKDAHPWNILFEKGQPYYIDVGSIIPFDKLELARSLEEFRIYFLLPLKLFSIWGSKKTYQYLNQPIPNCRERTKLSKEISLDSIRIFRWLSSTHILRKLIRKVERIKSSALDITEWSNYEQKAPNILEPDSFLEKQRPAYEILRRIGPGTLLDIGCNKGWYSLLAESMGFKVVAIDIDLASLGTLYNKVKSERRHILPLYVNFCAPTKANGLNDGYPDFIKRMRCDVVFAMAINHHLAYKQDLSFEDFAKRIAEFTIKVAVVEFIPKEDFHVSQWNQTGMEWYTRENFVKAFMLYFKRMESFPSTPSPREVFIFDKLLA